MATKISSIYTLITADDKPLKRGLVKARGEAVKGAARIQKALNKINFKAIGIGVAAMAGTAAYGMKQAVDAASDLEEATGKFSVVFRDQLALAEKWSDELVSAYGLSDREAREFLSSIQDLLKPMGVASDEAARLSNEVVKLAVDLGSFNNQKTEDVIRDIQSALVGNYETMKKYGVVLNVATIKQEALRSGLLKTGQELTAAQKATMAYKLIVNASADAMGDWARTQGSYANQMKQLTSNIENVKAALGTALLPAISGVTAEFNEWIKTNDKFFKQDLPGRISKIGSAITRTSKAVADLIALYDKLPSGITGAAAAGIIGRILFGGIGPAAIIAALAYTAQEVAANTKVYKEAFSKTIFGDVIGGYKQLTDITNRFIEWLKLQAKEPIEFSEFSIDQKEIYKAFKDPWMQKDFLNDRIKNIKKLRAEEAAAAVAAAAAAEKRKKQLEKEQEEYIAILPVMKMYRDAWEVKEIRTATEDQIKAAEAIKNTRTEVEQYIATLTDLRTYRDAWEVKDTRKATEQQIEAAEKLTATTEDAFNTILELSERTAWAMQENFSNVFYDAMKGKLNNFRDYFDAFLDSLQRGWADLMGQMMTQWIFGQDMKGGGLLSDALGFVGRLLGGGGSDLGAGGAGQIGGATNYSMGTGGYIGEPVKGFGTSSGKSYEFHPNEFVIPNKTLANTGQTSQPVNVYNVYNISALDTESGMQYLRRIGAVPLLASENLAENGMLRSAIMENV